MSTPAARAPRLVRRADLQPHPRGASSLASYLLFRLPAFFGLLAGGWVILGGATLVIGA